MKGVVVKYDEKRGFGFFRCAEQEDDVFFHVSDLPEGSIPSVGQLARFRIKDTSKGPAAVEIELGEMQKSPFQKYGLIAGGILTVSFLVFAFYDWSMVSAYLLSINVATFIVYAVDKAIAGGEMIRVPENLLHLMALVGGSPGALIGQKLLRHKIRKGGFAGIYWMIVIGQIVALYFLW